MPQPYSPSPPLWRRLALAIESGDADALGEWYQLEWPAVFRLCLGLLADHAKAEDAAQDAMLRISDKIASWDPVRPYAAWRTTVVLNLCRDVLRRQSTRRDKETAAAGQFQLTRLPDLAIEAERAEVRDAIQGVLGSLSDREREAFVLRDLEALPTEEVARAMGIHAATVRTLLTLARRRLRGLLAPHLPGVEVDGGAA